MGKDAIETYNAKFVALENTFKEENIRFIFEKEKHEHEFIAETNDRFSEMTSKETFGWEWSHKFPCGRYVILVLQRHSLIEKGEVVFRNDSFQPVVGKFSRYRSPNYILVLDQPLGSSHIIRSETSHYQSKCFPNPEEAEKSAIKYSLQGFRVAIMSWFEDYDMY